MAELEAPAMTAEDYLKWAAVPFRKRLKRACEDAVLTFVKYALVLGLWAGTGFLLWREIAVVRAQAQAGQLANQYLQQNYKELQGLIDSRKLINEAVAKAQDKK
jgi:hypothetical protein